MESEYGRVYRDLYTRHWWWRAREAVLLRTLRRLRAGRPRTHVLDVGSGDGLFFDGLAEFGEVTGVEPDGELIAPDSPHRERIFIGPFDERFRPGVRYGLITMLDVLEHLDDPAGALRHALGLLEPGGAVVATVPAFPLLWSHHDALNQHRVRFTAASFRRLAALARADVREIRYFFHWTFPAKLAVRAMERVRGPGGPERVPPAPLNRALYGLSRAEEALLGRLRLPFGTSLLAVCTPAGGDA